MHLAAACTSGKLLPNMERMEPFNVIYQTAEDGLVDHVEGLHALHVRQQLSVGAGSGKVHGKVGLALARIALQHAELSKGQIRLPKPFHRG